MDLISRNEVIKIIDELRYVNCHDRRDFEANSRVDKIRQRIVEMPTIHDTDNIYKNNANWKQLLSERFGRVY